MFQVSEARAEFREEMDIRMPIDEAFDLYVNDSYVTTLVMSPSHVEEAVVGFLVGSRAVSSLGDIVGISRSDRRVDVRLRGELKRPRLFVDDCVGLVEGGAPVRSKLKINRQVFWEVVGDFEERNRFHGLQAAGIYDTSSRRAFVSFDVSRFSSVAKAIGTSLLSGADLSSSVAIASGRISADLVAMVANCGIPILAGFKSLLYGGFRNAALLGLTLVLIRGGEVRVLTYPERVEL
ncbi:MAG: formate dehydrogenase accessory sulfurtransferase FdhD [Acidilobaceae archaeon]|nr:formate dehydrogenase accessory sulfurtransferase FdhD [Acidilobaceae archaeon]MCX8165044.1 formate dehydrogenase accessory sulfurtransferase FdhD [Acidilobaceae archaeon]MDW7974439.1 formate dehydrogenase accessory sulfurtransferase FdhD [Sulfolobales archaeon]